MRDEQLPPPPGRRSRWSSAFVPGLVRDSAALVGLRAASFGASFLFSLVLANSAGAVGAGQYYLAVAVTTLGYVASKLGTDGSLLRLIESDTGDEAVARRASVYRSAWILVGGASSLMTVVLFVSAPWIASGIYDDAEITSPLRITALAIPAMALTSVTGRSLLAMGRPLVGSAVEGGALSATQLLLYVAGLRSLGVDGAAISLLIANVALLAYGTWRWAGVGWSSSQGTQGVRGLLAESVPFLWTDLLGVVSGFVGTITLGALSTSADAGVYAVASRVAKLGSMALVPVMTLTAPHFARSARDDDREGLRRHLRTSTWWLSGLAAVVTVVIVVVAPLAADLLGGDFDDSVPTMRLLAIGYGINIGTGASVAMLQMTGRAQVVNRAMFASTVLQVGLSVALIPEYGPEGAACASIAAIVLKSATCTWVARAASAPSVDDRVTSR